jgi:lipid A 3-O-deacylase
MQYSFKLLVIFLFATFSVAAQHKMYKNEFGFKSENDSFLATGQDRYYTNGLFISFRRAQKPNVQPDSNNFNKKIIEFSFGQSLYNAQTGAVPNINFVDRPFAAYLYGAVALQYLSAKEISSKFKVEIGTIGPNAYGFEIQDLIHQTFGFYELNGWQYQVNNELGLKLEADMLFKTYQSGNKKTDISIPVKATLGNIFTGLSTGVLLRMGNLNPLYHSVATQSNVSTFKEKGVKQQEFYFFLKPIVNIVAYDATIAGGLFSNDKGPVTFDAKPIIFSQELGLAYAKNRWTVDFSLIFRTKETKTMFYAHQYGSFDLYYRF